MAATHFGSLLVWYGHINAMGLADFNYGVPEYGVKDIMESNYYQLSIERNNTGILFFSYRSDGAFRMSDILDGALENTKIQTKGPIIILIIIVEIIFIWK